MDHGARPKISSQKSAFSNTDGNPSYYNGKIPSLEVSGINQGFLARHTTDQSLPYSSYSDDHDLRASGPQTSITRVPITRSGWQLSNQHQHPQSGRTSSYFPSEDQRVFNPADPRMTRHEAPTYHLSISGHFPGATGTQGANSFSRQAWMPSDYPTTWLWPPYDVNRYQTNPSSFRDLDARDEPALNSAAERSQTSAPSEDYSLVALERKVAEACAVVEKVLKEREERTKRQREEAQRQREAREMREREARERREREDREMREREEREMRERQAREMREREERGMRDRADREIREQREREEEKREKERINEGSQTCSGCGARMSEYFCFICKHFTGVDKNPFHCNKCGICRIYRDRSFHCDVCNVCLDKRLEGKHKCRPDSGHDECCICLEDAFSGCQILPCSHKVHRECAIAMIQNGV
ncbi:hypothetical protein OS493_006145 [Desmophyllum pertusum]|uniref:CTCHY-type domain-containing protein n=1 Tax=Desmophyllum pertusum TaxID=174260 RepID=A0A9X0DCN0_9CNID|nr:hypothetical protein OS493_006145 [Desmophyllum pertusum]